MSTHRNEATDGTNNVTSAGHDKSKDGRRNCHARENRCKFKVNEG
jgi:hypothetical protein